MKPKRIQRKRTKGWKMPPNTVYVGRPGKWGNPYTPDDLDERGRRECVAAYREHWWKKNGIWRFDIRTLKETDVRELRGKDLACWCPLVDKDGKPVPCHADVLLEIANS